MQRLIITLFIFVLSGSLLQASVVSAGERVLQLPEVPAALTVPAERLKFVLDNYWEHMPWNDAEAMADSMFIEQSAVDFFDLLTHADSTTVDGAYSHLLEVQTSGSGAYITQLAIEYLYSPDSPVFSRRTYEAVAAALLRHNAVDDVRRLVLESDLENLVKNRPGTVSADFEFTDRDGNTRRLSEMTPLAEQTILFFYDPDCTTCAEVEKKMAADSKLSAGITAKRVQVVAIDPYGSDSELWREHAATLPAEWCVGYSPDGEVDNEELYLLLTSPTIYVLDREGRVLREP